jgi:hypothetical protein
MRRRLLSLAGGVALLFAAAGLAAAQDAQSASEDWTVVEYPEGREVVVELRPTALIPGAKGTARVTRGADETTVAVEVSGLGADSGAQHLFAVGHDGRIVPLGAVTVGDGAGTLEAKTQLGSFMLVLSPDAELSSFDSAARLALRSAVPDGFAVVPREGGVQQEEAASNAAAEEAVVSESPEYDVPLIGVSSLRRGAETQLKANLSGGLEGVRTGVYVKPLKSGVTRVRVQLSNLREPEAGTRYVLWTVAPDQTYTRLGEAGRPDSKNGAKIEAQTTLRDFGLFITAEGGEASPAPKGPSVATVVR